MSEYIILWHFQAGELSGEVNTYISEGWVVAGGMSCMIDSKDKQRFYQAMTRDDSEIPAEYMDGVAEAENLLTD